MAEVMTSTTSFSVIPGARASKPAVTPMLLIAAALRMRSSSADDLTLRSTQTASLPSTIRAFGKPSRIAAK